MSTIVRSFEHSLALPFFGIGMKTDLFQSCGHCWVFQIFWHIECNTFTASSFSIWSSSAAIELCYADAGRDWGQEEKGMTEDEMARWHHRLDGRESEWTPGDGDEQGGLACCDSWGRKELDTTEWLNWTELMLLLLWSSIAPSPPLAFFLVMLLKAHLTSHSRMSGSRWVITPSWPSGSWRYSLYSSSVYFCHLFLISCVC